jgi:hypothetical protein
VCVAGSAATDLLTHAGEDRLQAEGPKKKRTIQVDG